MRPYFVEFSSLILNLFRASGHDTVGAVAIDRKGDVAFATSTGGITAKMPGRVGDSPLVGMSSISIQYFNHIEAVCKIK